jgi:putative CocE/NonD family hydrolase
MRTAPEALEEFRFKRRLTAVQWLVILLAASLGAFAEEADRPDLRTENVILVTLDGVRLQEIFGGMDPVLVDAGEEMSGIYDIERARDRFWRPSPGERREALMPFFWKELAGEGIVLGNQKLGSTATVANPLLFSGPGYMELLTGQVQPEADSNALRRYPFPTVLDHVQQALDLEFAEVAMVGSWEGFEFYASHLEPEPFFVNAGYKKVEPEMSTPRMDYLGELQDQIMALWEVGRSDAVTFGIALEYLRKHHPKFLWIALGEGDDWTHARRYDRYLDYLHVVDSYLRELWTTLESMESYRGKTSLILVPDHGRGVTPEDWVDHEEGIPGAENIWVAVIGPDTPDLGEVGPAAPVQLRDIAATLLRFFDLDPAEFNPESGAPIDLAVGPASTTRAPEPFEVHRNVAVPMRDGVILRANVWRPASGGPFPTLVYRTPYGKDSTEDDYNTHLRAVDRGYAVVLQDVRGRYQSDGEFDPYKNEGRDGYDTIEWAAAQPWSNGRVGTFGLSYPGAVQWLAALEAPPHLEAMVPAMTFSTPRNFFYSGGVFDASWISWIYESIAPDIRRRKGLSGPKTAEEASAIWESEGFEMRTRLPLDSLEELREAAPFYFEWLAHPPEDPWWDWAEIRGRYDRVTAAVLNVSGWYDEAYGPEGATTNFNGLVESRRDKPNARTALVIGPWVHGVDSVAETTTGDIDFGADAAIDYDDLVLRWMDHYLKGIDNGVGGEPPVRTFLMGANRWYESETWPAQGTETMELYLLGRDSADEIGSLDSTPPATTSIPTTIASDPAKPVTDAFVDFGPHDYRDLASAPGVLVFDTEPLERDMEISGPISAEIYLSCDCPDTDLWVRLLDVAPDGSAFNLMSPGLDVMRASYRRLERGRQLLEPGTVYRLDYGNLMTSNLFRQGHRIRVQISTAFAPHFSRNLHSGELETTSKNMRPAVVSIHHDARHPSRITLPVVNRQPAGE